MNAISFGTTHSLSVLVRLHWTRFLCSKAHIYKKRQTIIMWPNEFSQYKEVGFV